MLLSDAIQGYFLDKRLTLAKSTVLAYRYWLNHLATHLQDPQLEEIKPMHIRRWFDYLEEECGLSKRSISDAWVPLSSLWTWAESELDTVHIMRKVQRREYHDKPIEPFTKGEIKKLVNGAKYTTYERNGKQVRMKRSTANRDAAIMLTLLDSGLRVSELCSLTIGDYDSDRGRLYVSEGKGGKDRVVFVGNVAQKALWKMMIERKDAKPGEPLFSSNTGEHLNRSNLRHLLQRIGKRVEVSNVHPHRFRHTFAITAFRNGANVAVIKESLGHATLDMTLRYAHIAEVDMEKAGQAYSPADNWKLK